MLSLFAPRLAVASSVVFSAVRGPRRRRRGPAGRLAPSARAGSAGHRREARRVRDGLGRMESADVLLGIVAAGGGGSGAGVVSVFRGDDVGDRGPRQVVGGGRARRCLHGCDGRRLWCPWSLAATVTRRPGGGNEASLSLPLSQLLSWSIDRKREREKCSLFFPFRRDVNDAALSGTTPFEAAARGGGAALRRGRKKASSSASREGETRSLSPASRSLSERKRKKEKIWNYDGEKKKKKKKKNFPPLPRTLSNEPPLNFFTHLRALGLLAR